MISSILAFWSLRDALLGHLPWLLLLLPLALLIPGMPAATLAFVRTTIGKILIAMTLAATLGWEARASLDQSAATRSALAAAEARATEADRQARAARDVGIAANAREAAADATARTLEKQIDAYARTLASPANGTSHDPGCRLSERDARRLRNLGAGR
jgi:hypothetical protein